MTLSLKGTITGLCKIAGREVPEDLHLEAISQSAFSIADKDRDAIVDYSEFVAFMYSNPEAVAWMDYFDDLADDSTMDPISRAKRAAGSAQSAQWAKTDMIGNKGKEDRKKSEQAGPWEDIVSRIEPSDPPPIPDVHAPPSMEFAVEWVHGYSSACARARYVSSKDQRALNEERHKLRNVQTLLQNQKYLIPGRPKTRTRPQKS